MNYGMAAGNELYYLAHRCLPACWQGDGQGLQSGGLLPLIKAQDGLLSSYYNNKRLWLAEISELARRSKKISAGGNLRRTRLRDEKIGLAQGDRPD